MSIPGAFLASVYAATLASWFSVQFLMVRVCACFVALIHDCVGIQDVATEPYGTEDDLGPPTSNWPVELWPYSGKKKRSIAKIASPLTLPTPPEDGGGH